METSQRTGKLMSHMSDQIKRSQTDVEVKEPSVQYARNVLSYAKLTIRVWRHRSWVNMAQFERSSKQEARNNTFSNGVQAV